MRIGDRFIPALRYGPSDRTRFDLLRPAGWSEGTVIFVHGGYWRAFHRHDWSFLAAGANARDWSMALPSYDLCPKVSIATITQQIAAAVTAIAAETSGPLTLTGHSAGGHLVARMLAPGMLHQDILARITAVAPISPISDLTPLIHTAMNADFRLDDAMAQAESLIHQPKADIPVHIQVGQSERPAFLDQATWLAKAWNSPLDRVDHRHHFDIIDALKETDSTLVRLLTATN